MAKRGAALAVILAAPGVYIAWRCVIRRIERGPRFLLARPHALATLGSMSRVENGRLVLPDKAAFRAKAYGPPKRVPGPPMALEDHQLVWLKTVRFEPGTRVLSVQGGRLEPVPVKAQYYFGRQGSARGEPLCIFTPADGVGELKAGAASSPTMRPSRRSSVAPSSSSTSRCPG